MSCSSLQQTAKSCWNSIITNGNPKTWDLTSEKVAKYAATVLVASLVTIAFAAIIVTCPRATGALFTTLSLTALVSMIILIIGAVKRCGSQQQKPGVFQRGKEQLTKGKETLSKATTKAKEGFSDRMSKSTRDVEEDIEVLEDELERVKKD